MRNPITKHLLGNHSVGWRDAWRYDDNRPLIIAGLVWLIFAGFAIYGMITMARNLI